MVIREPCSSVRKATPAVDMERLKRTSLMLYSSVRIDLCLISEVGKYTLCHSRRWNMAAHNYQSSHSSSD